MHPPLKGQQVTFDRLQRLTEPQRECLRAYFVSPNYKAVAKLLNISVDAVKDRLERARRSLGVVNSHTAAYMFAVYEGHATPPNEGWPPSKGLVCPSPFPPEMPLPKSEAPVSAVYDSHSAISLPTVHEKSKEWGLENDHPKDRFRSLASRVLRAAEIIALIVALAWLSIAAINGLRPSFFRFLDNLHL